MSTPARLTVSDDGSYLIGHTVGQHTAAMERAVARDLLALMTTTGLRHVLLDAREQQRPLETMETYALWEELAPLVPRGAKVAVVVGWPMSGRPFTENVARNRMLLVRYFNQYDEAVAWLRG